MGLPFLLENPVGYIARSFNLGRVFIYFWSVNWKFVPEEIFLSQTWGISLLGLTVLFWVIFAIYKWMRHTPPIYFKGRSQGNLSRDCLTYVNILIIDILAVLFTSNFIGIVFSRSLHYQFYVWYFHTLIFLLWFISSFPVVLKIILLISIEICWNIYPSNSVSSLVLFGCHLTILGGLWFTNSWNMPIFEEKK